MPLIAVASLALVGVHCGGDVSVGAPLGEGGTGGADVSNTSSSAVGTVVSTSVSSSTGSMVVDCADACFEIYRCGHNQGRCNGFAYTPGDRDNFLYGEGGDDGCIAACDGDSFYLTVVDPDDCDATIDTLKAARPEFAALCGP